jgi:hypothetical protein
MKEVGDYLKPRGAVNQALIRGYPNEETRLANSQSSLVEFIG